MKRRLLPRRGERVVAYAAWSWACDLCADPFTGQRPHRFSDHALGTWNEAVAAALRANDRDTPRHPGAGPPDGAEAARLDELRGDLSRSEVLRRAIRAA